MQKREHIDSKEIGCIGVVYYAFCQLIKSSFRIVLKHLCIKVYKYYMLKCVGFEITEFLAHARLSRQVS
jgi:hypothetical protein